MAIKTIRHNQTAIPILQFPYMLPNITSRRIDTKVLPLQFLTTADDRLHSANRLRRSDRLALTSEMTFHGCEQGSEE
ncbi:hypothetical protein F5Y00DRAFT_224848 [Daldinia vernicosa]|uniref:uncharacterized protein n=1 Tax=Daldinia vernicosa TaxID=114800 RepID=UPI00200851CD|nr:uncharacterized protein F5Y00DRAFT_224848 [Daldinia vernicosa]KAI0853508.1 hypothetical protein F5Y00DRAFT_224848 [Daldinia vernicosa]